MTALTDADRERIRRLATGEERPTVPYRRPRRISAHNARAVERPPTSTADSSSGGAAPTASGGPASAVA